MSIREKTFLGFFNDNDNDGGERKCSRPGNVVQPGTTRRYGL